jgi:hypothetical protein
MEGGMDRGECIKEKYPIMIDQEEIWQIMKKEGITHSGIPY